MNEDTITLYVDSEFLSPYAMSVFVVLVEKGIPFQIETVDLIKKENLLPTYANLSLTRRIPTVIHAGFQLSESSAITEYIDDVYGKLEIQKVYPQDIQQKARARELQAWLRSDFLALREERSTEVVFGRQSIIPLTKRAKKDAIKLIEAADILVLDGQRNVFGDWCIVDTDLALMLNRLAHNGDELPEKLTNYARYQWERRPVQLWVNKKRSI